MQTLTASFDHLSSDTLNRVADHLLHGGAPLDFLHNRVARRALRIAPDAQDAAALLLVAAEGLS